MLGDGILWFEECRENDTAPWKHLILAFGYFAYQPEETEANQTLQTTTRSFRFSTIFKQYDTTQNSVRVVSDR
ncbi:MAG: hypothetical protein K0R17_3506 [Rariglobus sp.]|nr:hypothetical protein [Rariglobus sp.]